MNDCNDDNNFNVFSSCLICSLWVQLIGILFVFTDVHHIKCQNIPIYSSILGSKVIYERQLKDTFQHLSAFVIDNETANIRWWFCPSLPKVSWKEFYFTIENHVWKPVHYSRFTWSEWSFFFGSPNLVYPITSSFSVGYTLEYNEFELILILNPFMRSAPGPIVENIMYKSVWTDS